MARTTRPGTQPVPRPGTTAATVATSEASNPLLPDAITEAGRIADRFSGVQRALFAAAGDAATGDAAADGAAPAGRSPRAFWTPGATADPPATAAPAKPSKA